MKRFVMAITFACVLSAQSWQETGPVLTPRPRQAERNPARWLL